PSQPEYRRLALALAVLAIFCGWALIGGYGAVAAAVLAPLTTRWLVGSRRDRYRRRLEADIPDVANALADSLAAGRSLRLALSELGASLEGAAGAEFTSLAAEIELGRPTASAIVDL